jgi:transposase
LQELNFGKENDIMERKSTRVRAQYTLEFKLEALRQLKAGQSAAAVAASLEIADQTLHNWIKQHREGRLGGPASPVVSAEQMELARLRAELAKTKMELAIVKKAAAYFARESA